jgi:protoporphyrinogen oxidase
MIGIIGSGLSGLTAAKVLDEQGIDFRILEASDQIGGRIKSDKQDGYTFDHGFQVLLTSYPQVKKHLNLEKLGIKTFAPGARIFDGQNFHVISDPMRDPSKIFETLFAPSKTLKDALKTLSLRTKQGKKNLQTIDYLREFGFSEQFINSFFKPFFSGVFLEKELRTPSNYFSFLFNRFSEGYASVPRGGMQAIPHQLCENFQDKIQLNARVEHIEENADNTVVKLADGTTLLFDKVIIAVEAPALKKFFPDMELNTKARVVTTVYYKAPQSAFSDTYLFLNGSGKGRVNHIAFLSDVNPEYSPDGSNLISVNLLDVENVDPNEVLDEIKSWNQFETKNWSFLKTYPIFYAQPDEFYQGQFNKDSNRILFAGDFTETPSIEGAMASGEKAALKV